jgi:hypothetical protein
MRTTRFTLALVAGLALAVSPCAPAAHAAGQAAGGPHAPRDREYSYDYDLIDNSVVRPATRFFDVALLARKVTGHPREAANVDENDQVRLPSTWWQPRLGFRAVTPAEMLRGPGPGTGPAPGRWTVTHAKIQGVSPGFQIKDSEGNGFLVKFDPLGYPDLTCALDVIGSHLFWAAGYNVPDNTISSFRLEDLDIGKDATYADTQGRKHAITMAYIGQLLAKVSPPIDGNYRCSASRYLEGKPIGPYEYFGRRKDDPEDLVPHELRRELRGLWAMCAWLNHADSRGPNSLDTWVKGPDRSFVRHHLIDFNAILGAGATGGRAYPTGTEYYVDNLVGGRALVTLGLVPFAWEPSVDPGIRSVGFVESRTFDPASWRPDYPNPAFDERTARDVRWGVRIVAGFSDEMIRAAVDAGQYSDPRASDYIARILIERRDKLVRRWLPGTLPPQVVAR